MTHIKMKMNVRTNWHQLLLAGAFLLGLAAARPASAQVGYASVPFLAIEPDSRSAGMGNSGVAMADNAYAIFWNPAGLAFQTGAEGALTHSTWLPEFDANLYYEYLVGKYKIPGAGTIGAHVTYLHLGETEGRDINNQETGVYRSYDVATGISYGFKLNKNLSVGTSARLIYSNLAKGEVEGTEVHPGTTGAFDLAALYRTDPFNLGKVKTTFSAGMNLANMGPKISYSENKNSASPIPTNLRVGYAFKFDLDQYNSISFTNDFTKLLTRSYERTDSTGATETVSDPFYKAIFTAWRPIEIQGTTTGEGEEPEMRKLNVFQQLIIGAGVEYWYNQLFALRTGYFYENPYNGNRQFLTFGGGIRYNIVGIDFSYIRALEEFSPLSDTMRFTLLLNLGR